MMYERKNLILDYSQNPFTFDIELTFDTNDLDFDNEGSLSNKGLITNNLVFFYDFDYYSDINNITSLYPYAKAIPSGSTMILNPIGSTIEFIKDTYINKNYISLNGGYFSSLFLSGNTITTGSTSGSTTGITYQVMPSPSPIGYTLNYWVNFAEPNINGGYLFKVGDENNGYGFYYKNGKLAYSSNVERIAETGNTVVVTQTGSSETIFTGSTGNSWVNLTIVFKRSQALKKCCDECNNNEYNMEYELYPDCATINEIADTNKGTLMFFINGRPVYKTIIEEPIIKTYKVTIGQGFTGGISIASMYDKPLTIPEIIRNYYGLKDIYKRPENFGGINTIINSNLTK